MPWRREGATELLPQSLHHLCLYDPAALDRLVNQLQNVWWIEQPPGYRDEIAEILGPFDAMKACAAMDERLEQLAVRHSVR